MRTRVEKQRKVRYKRKVNRYSLPCSQCSPVHPVGHKQRYRLFVNPDWQVAPLRQWLLSQALCKKTQTNKQSTRKLTESFMFYSMFRIISKEVPVIVRSTYVTLVIYLIFGTPTPTSHWKEVDQSASLLQYIPRFKFKEWCKKNLQNLRFVSLFKVRCISNTLRLT